MRFLAGPTRVCVLLAAAVLIAGCGSAPEQIAPSGVDELSGPMADPDPDNFVDGVDNVWLALVPGRTWTYDVTGDARIRSSTRTVLDETRDIAGIATTVVRTVTSGGRGKKVSTSETFYAQDKHGNVWLFGASGDEPWQVGRDDDRAVLAMAAQPRHGDGYAAGYRSGMITRTATVLQTQASTVTPYGEFDPVVLIETSPEGNAPQGASSGEVSSVSAYARGTGLVIVQASGTADLYLVDLSR